MHDYRLVRTKRRTILLMISKEAEVIVRAPLKTPVDEIESFVTSKSQWIEKHLASVTAKKEARSANKLSADQIDGLRKSAQTVLSQKVRHFSEIMGVEVRGVKITSAVARWGSCSSTNGICFSYRVMLLPDRLIDYIVVHELAHIEQKNHSAKFYAVVERYMPDYKIRSAEIRELSKTLPV